jgi:hypothetical protein
MDEVRDDLKSVDPKAPHTFVERLSQPYSGLGGAYGGGPTGQGIGVALRKGRVPDDCELCGRRLSDPIHASSEEAADNENWPV